VVVELNGGNDGINTVVPYADEGYARLRKHLRLPTAELKKVSDQLGLHPALGDFARLLEDGRLTIVQGVGYPNPSRSHFQSMGYWQTARLNVKGDNPDADIFVPELIAGPGWLGRALDGAPAPADRAPASVSVGLRPPPVALRGGLAASTALARRRKAGSGAVANPLGKAGLVKCGKRRGHGYRLLPQVPVKGGDDLHRRLQAAWGFAAEAGRSVLWAVRLADLFDGEQCFGLPFRISAGLDGGGGCGHNRCPQAKHPCRRPEIEGGRWPMT
jgi:hypothetical protein